MKQDLFYIAVTLKPGDPLLRCILENEDANQIYDVREAAPPFPAMSPETLCLVRSSELPAERPAGLPANILCWEDVPLPAWFGRGLGCNLLILSYIPEQDTLRWIIMEMHSVQKRFQKTLDRIMESLYYGKGLQAIADIAAEHFENSVLIFDTNWKLLASSRSDYPKSAFILEAERTGYLSNEIVRGMLESGGFDRLRKNGQYVVYPGGDSFADTCWCYVRVNGMISAYLVIYADNRKIEDYHPELLWTLSRYVSMELQRGRGASAGRNEPYEALLVDLLERRIVDQLVIIRRLSLLRRKVGELKHVVTVRKMSSNFQIAMSRVERARLEEMFPGCLSVEYDGSLVLLVSGETEEIPLRDDLEMLAHDFSMNSLAAGVSASFTDLGEMSRYYQQSVKALEFGWNIRSRGGLFRYSDYAIYHALELCTKHLDLRDLCHPGLLKLQESTDPVDRDLFQTLYLYLLHMKDVGKVSSLLNIHRSTLFYRLNKLKQVMDVDLDDGETVTQLLFSFKLIEYMDIFSPEDTPFLKR